MFYFTNTYVWPEVYDNDAYISSYVYFNIEILVLRVECIKDIHGIKVGSDNEIKMNANNSTYTLWDIESVKNIVKKIDNFSNVIEPKLNNNKDKCILLCPFKICVIALKIEKWQMNKLNTRNIHST